MTENNPWANRSRRSDDTPADRIQDGWGYGDDDVPGADGRYPGTTPTTPGHCYNCDAKLPTGTDEDLCEDCQGHSAGAHNRDFGGDYRSVPDANLPDTATTTSQDSLHWEIQQIQFAVVAAVSKHIAAAKGAVALDRAAGRTPGVDRATPIYDFETEVPDLFEQRWGGTLPRVTTTEATTGQRLLRIAFEDLTDHSSDTPADVGAIPRFVDTTGAPIDTEDPSGLLEGAIDGDPMVTPDDDIDIWLFPGWALSRQTDTSGGAIEIHRKCPRCERYTHHAYIGPFSTPAGHFDAGLYQCPLCQRRTFGPKRDAALRIMDSQTERRKRADRLTDHIPSLAQIEQWDSVVDAGEFSPPDAGGERDD